MKNSLLLLTIVFLFSCSSSDKNDKTNKVSDAKNVEDTGLVKPLIDSISDYDMSTVDKKNSKEFKENLMKIEREYGNQWSFCDCVIKGDSINKAFAKPDISDVEFDRLSKRFDEIDEKCRAFRIQNPNITPEERNSHEKKVKNCLKNEGIIL